MRISTLFALGLIVFLLYAGDHPDNAARIVREIARACWALIHFG